ERLPGLSRLVVPVVHHRNKAVAQGSWLEDSAVEEYSRRRARLAGPRLVLEERRQVPGDGRVANVGQAHFVQAGGGATAGLGISRHNREEAVEDHLANVVGFELRRHRTAYDLPAAADDRDGEARRRRWPEEGLFRHPARLGQQA